MRQDREHTLSWIGLSRIPGVGRITFRRLIRAFGSAQRVLGATDSELRETGGLSDKIIGQFRAFPWREFAESEVAQAGSAGVTLLTADDPEFPGMLRSIPDAPLVLYIKGRILPQDGTAVALVGTRTPTHYGMNITRQMAHDLASNGYTVVSGMARGIDSHAHRGALAARGRTIAVLGSGIDMAYPPENKGLMEDIARSGAVITENPFGTRPESGYFPARNRIISGLATGTVIIEAAEDSGSLITADYALKQGRKLFAVPGNVSSPVSRGSNCLIKQGAMLAETAADVFRGLDGAPVADTASAPKNASRSLPHMTTSEAAVFRSVTGEPKHIDVLRAECGMPAGQLSGILTSLELKGVVQQLPGKFFCQAARVSE